MKKQKTTDDLLFALSVPMLIHSLTQLLILVGKAESYAQKKKMTNKTIFEKRLYPDMFHFGQQVQYAYFVALDVASNLSGRVHPMFKYDEKTTADLKKSLRRTIVYLKTLKPVHFKGAEKKRAPVFYDKKRKLPAVQYLQVLGLPDFFFHYTTAYNILRHLGVPIGKSDYLGRF